MTNQKAITDNLAALLEQHTEEIAASWAEKTYRNARFRPGELWLDVLRTSTTLGLRSVIDALRTGSYASLEVYLADLSTACLRSGFESGGATESLLLLKEAVLTVISRYAFGPRDVWAVISELDVCLRWAVRHFNTLYAAETNRCLREQHKHIASMLKMGEQVADSVDMDEVFRHVAQGVINATQTEHCDFYLVDEDQQRLIPKVGVSKSPLPEMVIQHFLDHSLNVANEPFFREILERKEPAVCENAQADARTNKTVTGLMGTKSVLAVPLVAHHRVLALAITGTFHSYRTFTEEQIELAWDVARAATLVIENAQLHQQSRHIATLEERERLAREIHDNLAQSLGILKLQASNVNELLGRGQFEQAQTFLTEMVKTATEAHTDAREAIFGLRNSASSASELLPTLRAYLDKFRSDYDIDVHLAAPDEAAIALPNTAVIQLTRVIQEMLTNVRKHANARAVWVRLERDDANLSVTVEDDGQGFDLAEVLNKECGGVGLQIMRERAESLDGHLQIDTQPGKGTRVTAQIPLPNGK
jgi:signal transduction histidine kinase